jgi:hypothetical protein
MGALFLEQKKESVTTRRDDLQQAVPDSYFCLEPLRIQRLIRSENQPKRELTYT